MRREATPEEHEEIHRLIPLIEIGHDNSVKLPKDHADRIHHLVRSIHGYRVSGPCKACMLSLVDILRRIVGLGPARRPASESLVQRRLTACYQCPAYHPSTGSCGRFILDAIQSHPVVIEGRNVYPCGCNVSLKAAFTSETCPADRWPNR